MVVSFLGAGLGCGGGSTDATALPELMTRDPAAHIVCGREDPCPKGSICLSGVRCAKLCKSTADCPTGQACTGSLNGRSFCQ
jgi:hypothetical protein